MADFIEIAIPMILAGIGWFFGHRYRRQDRKERERVKEENESPFGRIVSNIH
jgi:hypothetical protein